MQTNKDIWLLTADLGYKMFDKIREDFPERFVNTGASEQNMLDMVVGLAQGGKIPVCYSITPFLLYRPFETLRTYINHEKTKVLLVGSGRDQDYLHDGISHWAEDARGILKLLRNIKTYWPDNKEEIKDMLSEMLSNKGPSFISLKR